MRRAMAAFGTTYAVKPQWSIRAEWDGSFDVGDAFALNAQGNGRFRPIDAVWVTGEYRF